MATELAAPKSHPQQLTAQLANGQTVRPANTLQDNENGAFGQDKYRKFRLLLASTDIKLLTQTGNLQLTVKIRERFLKAYFPSGNIIIFAVTAN